MATLVDIYTREIVGWAISTRHNTELIIEALNNALSKYDHNGPHNPDSMVRYKTMLNTIHRQHPTALKTKVALDAIKEVKTLAELSSAYGVHTTQIRRWKEESQENY